ncbi:hypothetical protein QFZ79_003950 [Arthrobacter sp. V4I6]|nr:hypothetical protein [Arthrobacter sp. V1I7]MDQ0855839.1 hypothetical protein [Arthrobacter sp. V4I6]
MKFSAGAFEDDGAVKDESAATFLRHYRDEYGALVQRVAAHALGHIGDLEPDTQTSSPADKQPPGSTGDGGSGGIECRLSRRFLGAGSCPVAVSGCYAALASRSSAIASATMTALSGPRTSI